MLDAALCHIRGDVLAIEVVDIEDLGHLDAHSDVIESFRFGGPSHIGLISELSERSQSSGAKPTAAIV